MARVRCRLGPMEGAYAAMHRTDRGLRTDRLASRLAAWIVETLRAWSDYDGDVERSFTKDEILTNVTLYWLTGTTGSLMRMHHANAAMPPAQLARRVEVPSGFSLFPGDIVRPPRAWLERTANVARVPSHRPAGIPRRSRNPSSTRKSCARSSALPGDSGELSAPIATIAFAVRMASELRTGSAMFRSRGRGSRGGQSRSRLRSAEADSA